MDAVLSDAFALVVAPCAIDVASAAVDAVDVDRTLDAVATLDEASRVAAYVAQLQVLTPLIIIMSLLFLLLLLLLLLWLLLLSSSSSVLSALVVFLLRSALRCRSLMRAHTHYCCASIRRVSDVALNRVRTSLVYFVNTSNVCYVQSALAS